MRSKSVVYRDAGTGHGLAWISKSIKVEATQKSFRGLTITYRSGLEEISSGVPELGIYLFSEFQQ